MKRMSTSLAASLLLLAACSSSHGPADGSVGDATSSGCPLPVPTGCVETGDDPPGCCTDVAARCVDGAWLCLRPGTTFTCHVTCGTSACAGLPPPCRQDLGDGCCGELRPAECSFRGDWVCATGDVPESACDSVAPACGPMDRCATLAEDECIADPDCGPLYDDFCCPVCTPGGGCADCTRPQMYQCGSIGAACADDPPVCGLPAPWSCAGEIADCSMALPAAGGRCTVPGCVVAITAACPDCPIGCYPVRPDSCDADCTVPPPPCPTDTVPEAGGGCWTGRCIPTSACSPAMAPGL